MCHSFLPQALWTGKQLLSGTILGISAVKSQSHFCSPPQSLCPPSFHPSCPAAKRFSPGRLRCRSCCFCCSMHSARPLLVAFQPPCMFLFLHFFILVCIFVCLYITSINICFIFRNPCSDCPAKLRLLRRPRQPQLEEKPQPMRRPQKNFPALRCCDCCRWCVAASLC